jgi:uncharacterized protein (TIGR00369 family)
MTNIQDKITSSFNAQGLMGMIGARLALVQDGEVHIFLPFSKEFSQQHGYVHAGIITSIVDSACGYAALTKAPVGYEVVTAEFKVNFLRPAVGESFLALGRVQNSGKLLAVSTGEVRAFSGNAESYKIVALIQATMVYVKQ